MPLFWLYPYIFVSAPYCATARAATSWSSPKVNDIPIGSEGLSMCIGRGIVCSPSVACPLVGRLATLAGFGLPCYVICSPIFPEFFDPRCILKLSFLFSERAQIRRKHAKYESFNIMRRFGVQGIPAKVVPELSSALTPSSVL